MKYLLILLLCSCSRDLDVNGPPLGVVTKDGGVLMRASTTELTQFFGLECARLYGFSAYITTEESAKVSACNGQFLNSFLNMVSGLGR